MSLTKVNYIDNSTIITAKNLNDIQDNIIELDNNLNDIQDNIIKLNNNSISKDNIINNFTTTEEGFVADARALKLLNDSKMSMELLWENASPESSFAGQTVNLNLSGYSAIVVEHDYGSTWCHIPSQANRVVAASAYKTTYVLKALFFRSFQVNENAVVIDNATSVDLTSNSSEPSINNIFIIPLKIYGIKGVSV